MALLDMQGMTPERNRGEHGGGSDLSVLLCDSFASVTLSRRVWVRGLCG